jgi:hypothetical protein
MTGEEVVITGTIALPQEGVQNWNSGPAGSSNFSPSIPFVIRKRVKAA